MIRRALIPGLWFWLGATAGVVWEARRPFGTHWQRRSAVQMARMLAGPGAL